MSFLPRRFPATPLAALAISGMWLPFIAAPAAAGPFSAGTIVVERVGNGTATLSSTSTQISILEVTTLGGLAQTITLDTTGSNQQSDSGSASSNGYLNTYFSGTAGFVSVPGYNNAVGTASVTSQNTKVNSILDGSGNVISRTLFPTGGPAATPPSPFSGNNYRSSLATSGSTFYGVGTSSGSPVTGGMWYFDGTNFNSLSGTAGAPLNVTNLRNIEIYSNQLYFSAASGTFLGVSTLGTGVSTSGVQVPSLVINVGAGASTYGFLMFDTNNDSTLDLAYLADDRATVGGGLEKWVLSSGTWSNTWSLLVGASGTSVLQSGTGVGFAGLRGLAGTYDAVNGATLYATTTETSNNRLISILDTGLTTPSTYTTLQSAGANYAFRGVDLSPVLVPEPTALASLGCAAALYLAVRRRRAA